MQEKLIGKKKEIKEILKRIYEKLKEMLRRKELLNW